MIEILQFLGHMEWHNEIVKILAPLTDNPNAPNKNGETPTIWAARYGHTENVKILVPLMDNPNIMMGKLQFTEQQLWDIQKL